MRPLDTHSRCSRDPLTLSRRAFLRTSVGVTGASLFATAAFGRDEPLLDLAPDQPPARVAMARSRYVLDGPTVHPTFARELFESALIHATRTSSPNEAWHSLLGPDDIIGLKFNRSGQRMIATTDVFAEVIVSSLVDAGWPRDQIVCMELPEETARRLQTAAPIAGYDSKPTNFASGADHLASVLRQVTALITIPFLKTHNLCTLTCSLKNLSHGLVKHPARFHDHGCSPYIADIVATDAIASKLRLAIVDALRVVFADGPAATSNNVTNTGAILVSTDPVAADAIGLALLNDVRNRTKLPPIAVSPAGIPYLVAAHRAELGVAAPHGIELVQAAD